MKIALAQIQPTKGDIQKNIALHLQTIEKAVEQGADLIIFPELSMTAYEPTLAKELAVDAATNLFQPFQKAADEKDIGIGIGMPTRAAQAICISMMLFRAGEERMIYSKQMLHTDEQPYFVRGREDQVIAYKGLKIGIGICYETLHEAHFSKAADLGAAVYIASVAKPAHGIKKAYTHFPQMAKAYDMPVLMANSVGPCDTFLSVGQSAVWSREGALLERLGEGEEGLLLYDTLRGETTKKIMRL